MKTSTCKTLDGKISIQSSTSTLVAFRLNSNTEKFLNSTDLLHSIFGNNLLSSKTKPKAACQCDQSDSGCYGWEGGMKWNKISLIISNLE